MLDSSMSRRNVLRTAVVTAAAASGAGLLASPADAAPGHALPYPDIVDTSHASKEVARIMRGFFTAKSRHDPDELMTYFDKQDAFYIDASSGSVWPDWDALDAVFHAFLPSAPPDALSYPIRIVGDEHSALVSFEDTPSLFGRELRILGSVTFNRRRKIVRWIDYWDGRSSQTHLPIGCCFGPYPTDFHDGVVNASATIKKVAQALQNAFSVGDAAKAAQLFTPDAVFEDMALHTRVEGQLQIQRYLTRGLGLLPYGTGGTSASLVHVVGSDQGGGYEWHAAMGALPLQRGITALELDDNGKITRFTTIYDSFQFPDQTYKSLVALGAEQ